MLKIVQSLGAQFKSVDELQNYVGAMGAVFETADKMRALISHPVSRRLMLSNLRNIIMDLEAYDSTRDDEHIGRFLFDVGVIGGISIVNSSNRPPKWFADFAATKCIIPWIYANGRPFPLFDEQDARLKWGGKVIKRSKTRADAHSTFQVLACIDAINIDIERMKSEAAWMMNFSKTKGDNSSEWTLRASKLPPLSEDTRDEWWDEIKLRIRKIAKLPDAYKNSIAASVGNADSSIMNEHLKRCKRAFFALVP